MIAETKEFYQMLKPVEDRPAHSPLGASGAERWMNCPGSVGLINSLDLPVEESDHALLGTSAHEAGAYCLDHGSDAWEAIGMCFGPNKVDAEMAEAIQVYLDECRPYMAVEGAVVYVEKGASAPQKHPQMYGTVDFGCYLPRTATLIVRDYKHGIGITVEADDNPQLKYYAYLLLQEHPEARTVSIGIVQPRGFHSDGPVRYWETTAEAICEWVDAELVPAMNRTATDETLDMGEHCRFCPARIICPAMIKTMYEVMDGEKPDRLPDVALGARYEQVQALKHFIKAVEDETFRRAMDGKLVPGVKLVNKKANRVWKDGSDALFKARFGDQAFTVPSLKSPAEMEKIGPAAKSLVHEWAHTPTPGLTIALESDPKPAVTVKKGSEVFAGMVE